MPTITDGSIVEDMTERGTTISESDFRSGPADGEELSPGEIDQIARAEVGEDGDLASYEVVWFGEELGSTGRSSKGKIDWDLRDGDGNEVDDRTEIRIVGQPLNRDSREELMAWERAGDLREEDPSKRIEFPPVTSVTGGEERPEMVRHGREVALEVRHPSDDVTVSLQNSSIPIPATVFY